VITVEAISRSAAYRYIHSPLRLATNVKKILMIFDEGQVEMLTG